MPIVQLRNFRTLKSEQCKRESEERLEPKQMTLSIGVSLEDECSNERRFNLDFKGSLSKN